MLRPSPSIGELEIALHQLLSKGRFTGAGHIHVTAGESGDSPAAFHVALGADAAEALIKLLSKIPLEWTSRDPTHWVLSAREASAIVQAAAPKPAYWPLSRAFTRRAAQRLPF